MPAKHDDSTQAARRRYIETKRLRFTLNCFPDEFELFRAACERNHTTPTTEIRRFMAEYTERNQL